MAKAAWSEFDLKAKLWVIPASRMKGWETGKAKAVPHAVPLTDDILVLLESLPRFKGGDFPFQRRWWKAAGRGFSVAKSRLDAAMRADLEAQGETFLSFTIHDIRRTCRTRFSALRVQTEVAEALLAHAKPGLHKTYNKYEYLDEKRHALELWHAKLRSIVEPRPDGNVIPFAAAGR